MERRSRYDTIIFVTTLYARGPTAKGATFLIPTASVYWRCVSEVQTRFFFFSSSDSLWQQRQHVQCHGTDDALIRCFYHNKLKLTEYRV
eukprot:scaffold213_cov150-Skeletonema_menzelii.AAC.17